MCGEIQALDFDSQLTTAVGVHDLPPRLAASSAIHLQGTITYYDADNHILFLQDRTGGVFIQTDHPYKLGVGNSVDVKGRAQATYRTSVAMDPTITVLGEGHRIIPVRSNFEDLVKGRRDCRLVVIQGKVRAAEIGLHENAPSVHLDVAMPNGEIEVYVRSPDGFDPEALLDTTVEVTGVAGGAFDPKWQLSGVILYVPNISGVRVQEPPPVSMDSLPQTDLDDIFESQRVSDASRRLRVRGTLTYYKPGTAAVIENTGKSIFVQTRNTTPLELGDIVDAIGFASDREYAPSLREAFLRRVGRTVQIAARPTTFNEAISGLYSDDLISLSGKLVSQLYDSGADTLVLDVDGHLVDGFVNANSPIKNLSPGSKVRLTGICRIVSGTSSDKPNFFHLDMRNPFDVQLLAAPSWWTVDHLLMILAALTAISVLIASWAVVLRRRVLHQSGRITRSMTIAHERSKILKMISSNLAQEVLLSAICTLVMRLLPGTICLRRLMKPDLSTEDHTLRNETQGINILFRFPLPSGEEESGEELSVSAPSDYRLSEDSKDVFAALAELSSLAMQQSVLHQSLLYHSTHDALTRLPNRRLCDARLTEAITQSETSSGYFAVFYIDVNRFKLVNDTYGHRVGDSYLMQISERLSCVIRSADTLARVGGDEYIVIALSLKDGGDVSRLLRRLRECFTEPFHIDGRTIDGSASFGIACFPTDGRTADDLKRHADQAMYLDKRVQRTTAEAPTDLAIFSVEELKCAIAADRFWLAYQPQFSASGQLAGLETLLRLEDPILGTMTPDAFISVAERSDVIHELGAWVLARAVQDAVRWNLHTGQYLVIAVNVSARQLNREDFAVEVLRCLQSTGFPANRLELELVERSLVPGAGLVEEQLTKLREAGVRISLDDFGTSHSCLSRLHKLPIDTVKLDRSFVAAMDLDPAVLPIVRAISFMAKSLGKRIVAEGVEHVGPVPALLKMGITQFQGVLLGRALSASEIDKLLPAWRAGVALPFEFQSTPRRRRA